MRKKQQFILVSLLLALGLVFFTQFESWRHFWVIVLIGALAYLFSLLVLYPDLSGIEFLTLLGLPTLFTLGVASTLHFFPNFSFTFKLLFLFLFAFSFYIILLSENIFNVAKRKPLLPLLRAAGTASFLLTLFTAFLLFTAVFKARFSLWSQAFLIFATAFVLGLQSVWAVEIHGKITARLIGISFFLGLGVVEAALGLSFLPLESFFRALALSTAFYILLGAAHQYLRKTLTRRVFVEYGLVAFIVALILFII